MVDEDIIFADEESEIDQKIVDNWKIIIADDDREVHAMTNIVLRDVVYGNKGLTFLNAYSGVEAIELVKDNPDAEVILLDVVMENDNSGLEVVKHIREVLNNQYIRIILRTGQPGYAPEERVIIDYDINDYKEKTELSSQKLKTSLISSLRSYTDIITIAELNENLERKVIERTMELREANEKLRKTLKIINDDEEAGKKIQFKLLPQSPKQIDKYQFSCKLLPSLYLSGDFLDYFNLSDRYIGFYFADVSGHGASSAFVTILLKSFINNWIDKYREEHNEIILQPQELFSKLNIALIKEDLGKHLTLFYGLIDKVENKLIYTNAGQYPFPIIFDFKSPEFEECRSFPIGLLENVEYGLKEITLPEKFLMFLFSDGILDIMNYESLQEKNTYLLSLLNDKNTSINKIIEQMGIEHIEQCPDDITIMMIKKD